MTLTAAVETGAKINIYLEILGLRQDGYHELRSLFAPVSSPSDTLRLRPLPPGGGFRLTCSLPELEGGQNILHAAYEAFAAATGRRPDLEVHLEKRIPAGSGLGGGSADAAALLAWMNSRLPEEFRLGERALSAVAASVGSDVPFFLLGRTAWVTGAGEKVAPAPVSPPLEGLLIVCPAVAVSTAWAYREYDRRVLEGEGAPDALTRKGKGFKDHFCSSGKLWRNDFEAVVLRAHPELRSLKYALLQLGARAVCLNGSGSSMTALFGSTEAKRRGRRFLERNGVSHFSTARNRTGV